jgi:hypothetical protein
MDKNKTIPKEITKEAIVGLKSAVKCTSDYALAQKLNIQTTVLGRYSNGKTSITMDKLEEYANHLGLTIEIKFKKNKKK